MPVIVLETGSKQAVVRPRAALAHAPRPERPPRADPADQYREAREAFRRDAGGAPCRRTLPRVCAGRRLALARGGYWPSTDV